MVGTTNKTTFQQILSALTIIEKILLGVGILLIAVSAIYGTVLYIVISIIIALVLWGYIYLSLVKRLPLQTTSGRSEKVAPKEKTERLGETITEVKKQKSPEGGESYATQFFDFESEDYPSSSEPRSEFEFLLGKVLVAVKEALIAHTAAFFWANFEKKHLVFQGRASDSHNLISARRIPLENDIISQIAKIGKPKVITHISPNSEKDILPYYQDFDFVKSFVGVPVFYPTADSPKNVVGVLAMDSKAEDAFGPETLTLLAQFTKLLSALIKSHTEKYDLLLDSEILSSIRSMRESMKENLELRTIVKTLVEQTNRVIGYDYVAVIMFDNDRRSWVVYHVDSLQGGAYIAPHQTIDMEGSLVSTVISTNKHLLVDDMSTVTEPRYSKEEKIDTAGSILIAPISSFNKCYGALCIERKERSGYSRRDIEILYRLVENAASALEILYMDELVQKYVIIDDETGLLKKNYFEQCVKEEIERADDLGADLSLVVFSIDKINQLIERFSKDGCDKVVYSLATFLKRSVRSYDIVGRLDYNRFGVVLVHTTANDGYLWAEKLRKNFASQVLTIQDKTISVTVSSGVCGLIDSMQYPELFHNVSLALQKAIDNGGNIVQIY